MQEIIPSGIVLLAVHVAWWYGYEAAVDAIEAMTLAELARPHRHTFTRPRPALRPKAKRNGGAR